MCDIWNNGKIQREFETRSTDDQPTIQWLPVVGSWTFLGVNMHFNEKLFMCDSCNFLIRVYLLCTVHSVVIHCSMQAAMLVTTSGPRCWGTMPPPTSGSGPETCRRRGWTMPSVLSTCWTSCLTAKVRFSHWRL